MPRSLQRSMPGRHPQFTRCPHARQAVRRVRLCPRPQAPIVHAAKAAATQRLPCATAPAPARPHTAASSSCMRWMYWS